jgi:hypothetical protein
LHGARRFPPFARRVAKSDRDEFGDVLGPEPAVNVIAVHPGNFPGPARRERVPNGVWQIRLAPDRPRSSVGSQRPSGLSHSGNPASRRASAKRSRLVKLAAMYSLIVKLGQSSSNAHRCLILAAEPDERRGA